MKTNLTQLVRLIALGWSVLGLWPITKADTVTGGAAAAVPSPNGILLNPGNLAFVEDSFFDFAPKIYEINRVSMRYPGFNTIHWNQQGISPIAALSFAPNSVNIRKTRFRFLINEIVPPFSIPFSLTGVPVVVLDQLSTFDVQTKVNIHGALGGAIAYRVNSRLGLGMAGSYRSVELDNTLTLQNQDEEFARLKAGIDLASLTFGIHLVLAQNRLAIGASSVVFASQTLKSSVSGNIVNTAGSLIEPSTVQTAQFGKTLLVGIHLALSPYVSLRSDLQYTRANPEEVRFSIVDLENQNLESYDTIALRLGAKFWTTSNNVFAFGYAYEPSSVGSGERGPGTTTGFGVQDYVLILAGIDELKPYHRFVGAVGRSFGYEKGVAKWNAMVGFAYQMATLGVDEKGEQPAAYDQKKYFIPAQITYRY